MNVEIKYIYFDVNTGSFIFSKTKKTNTNYVLLPVDEIYKLSRKNIISANKYIIKQKLLTSFLYFSHKKIMRLSINKQSEIIKNIYTKPSGIWVSHGTSWLNYISKFKTPNQINLFTFIYKVEIFDNVKIITDKESLFAFIKKYKKKADEIRIYDVIDWERVKTDFAGLIITPHLGSNIWRDNYDAFSIQGVESAQDFFTDLLGPRWKTNLLLLCEWYRAWECEGGIIWDMSAISSFTLIKKMDHQKYLF